MVIGRPGIVPIHPAANGAEQTTGDTNVNEMRSNDLTLRLGKVTDADPIARMSRDYIEAGLGWAWTPARVAKNIRNQDTVTLVAQSDHEPLVAFAIMHFGLEEAHLNLLAVQPNRWRRGIGRRLMEWLEKSARVAGIATISLELRAKNVEAQRFYRALGFSEIAYLPRYYYGREAAIRMARELISPALRLAP